MRSASITRQTKETDVSIELNLDSKGYEIDIPVGFLEHMLELLSMHSGIGLNVKASGDTHIDLHHTTEDIGIVLGLALKDALGEKQGIERYGFAKIPMDETLVEVCMDLSGRPFFQIHGGDLFHGKVGDFDLELLPEFFKSVAFKAGINLHITVCSSGNKHHLAEACFKAFARALKEAVKIVGEDIPSTKATL
ncbi:MAG: imidazoleglycerol-phosphate dehydratase HisB [Thermodesulfobacteriota bacterium]|nr:imidazoleglycerol-phosphate dehydratase HisB [Thermodesulfobacteriota bacterium]